MNFLLLKKDHTKNNMDSTETDNFIKIILLLQNVTDKLRILFKNKWIIKFNKEWKNSIDDGNILIIY